MTGSLATTAVASVDLHAHLLPPAWVDQVAATPSFGVSIRSDGDGYVLTLPDGRGDFGLSPEILDSSNRIKQLDSMGIQMELVSPPTPTLLYELDASSSQGIANLYNETIAELCRASGGHLIGAATVPMAHPDLAVSELTHAISTLGLRALYVATQVGGRELGDPQFEPVWRRLAELGAPLLIHPSQGGGNYERLNVRMLYNSLGNPFETAAAAASLIVNGVLDRIPDLHLILVHGGGVFPYLLGRLDHSYHANPGARGSTMPPRSYVERMYFDTLVHDPLVLSYLVDTVGEDRVVIGTDAPYNMGDRDPLATIESVDSLTPDLLASNAARALGTD